MHGSLNVPTKAGNHVVIPISQVHVSHPYKLPKDLGGACAEQVSMIRVKPPEPQLSTDETKVLAWKNLQMSYV